MKLTWLGHACFLAEQDGYTILLDPYTGVEGYPSLPVIAPLEDVSIQATLDGPEDGVCARLLVNKVLCSHQHFDHNAVELTALLPEAPCPFAIRTVETFHDDQGGALRGTNTIHILTAGGFTIAHLGDLGHQLSPEQAEAIGPLDAVLIPVGGFYTIDARGAKSVCDMLNPRRIIPMHYRHSPYGLPNVAGVEDFLALWPSVRWLEGSSLTLEDAPEGVLVPRFMTAKD